MTEQDPWRQIDEALGLARPDPELVEAFTSAGFDRVNAERGAKLMRSGRYLGFADVAMSLATAGGRTVSAVQETQIAEATRLWEAKAAERNRSGTTPWGRPPVREAERDAFGRPLPARAKTPTVADFREVGLSEADAQEAAGGLAAGRFVSFEDACLSTAMSKPGERTLRETAMRAKAKGFSRADGR